MSAAIYDNLAKKLHIRIIAPDRPGFGLSDYQESRTLLGWADDVVALANHLNIKKFAIMGVSGGGPYAAACAYRISEKITRVGIVVGMGPILGDESLKGILWIGKIGWKCYKKYPFVSRISAYLQYLNARANIFPRLNIYAWGREDRRLLKNPLFYKRSVMTTKEAFRQGFIGPELDLKLYTNDWGFDIKKITSKIYLWYGADDQNVSLNMGKYYHDQITDSTLTVYPGEGHLVSISHADEILKTLTNQFVA